MCVVCMTIIVVNLSAVCYILCRWVSLVFCHIAVRYSNSSLVYIMVTSETRCVSTAIVERVLTESFFLR